MELSTSITISSVLFHRTHPSFTFNAPFLSRKLTLPSKHSSFSRTSRGLLYGNNLILRSTYEEGMRTDSTNYAGEVGNIKMVDDEPVQQESPSDDSVKELPKEDLSLGVGDDADKIKMEDDQPVSDDFPKEDSPLDAQVQTLDFIDKLDIKWDSDSSTYSSLLLGVGALVGLWLATAVVGAIDSIPLLPKFLEIVGLAYTLWFGTRFLIFKENRKELASKFEEIKKQVI